MIMSDRETWRLGGLGTWGLGEPSVEAEINLSPCLPVSLSPHSFKGSVVSYATLLPVRKHGRYEIVHLPAKRY